MPRGVSPEGDFSLSIPEARRESLSHLF
jgi:hypothetical protein